MTPFSLLSGLVQPITSLVSEFVEDKDEANRLSARLQSEIGTHVAAELAAQRAILTAEAKGESWLQRNWRPLTMLTFTALIVARWTGFAVPNLPEDLEARLFEIVQIGLGGYVIGRSAEKVARAWKEGGHDRSGS